MAQRFLYLLRHGQYARNGSLPGDSDGRLTMLGREQVALAAGRLAGLPIATIHHSTMRRAVGTTEAVAARFPGVTLQPSAMLRECIPFVPTGYESIWGTCLPRCASTCDATPFTAVPRGHRRVGVRAAARRGAAGGGAAPRWAGYRGSGRGQGRMGGHRPRRR